MNRTNSSPSSIPSSFSYLEWDLILRLVVLGIGILTNIVNIGVFLNPKLEDVSYKYMLTTSITNFVYLAITFIGVFLFNCSFCPSSQTYPAVIYSIGLIFYVSSCLAIFRIVVEIAISVRTYLILINRPFELLSYKHILIILLAISFIYYGQQPFIYDIVELRGAGGRVVYVSRANWFGSSQYGRNLVIVQFSVRIFLAVAVLSAFSFLTLFEFRKLLISRKNLTRRVTQSPVSFTQFSKVQGSMENRKSSTLNSNQNEKSACSRRKPKTSKNLTRMVIYRSFMSAIGTTPYALIYILRQTVFTSAQVYIYNSMSLALLVAPAAFELFVYYSFNRHFRSVLNGYFKILFSN